MRVALVVALFGALAACGTTGGKGSGPTSTSVSGRQMSSGRPEEIVTTARYLASPASSFTTGAIVRCDGGQS